MRMRHELASRSRPPSRSAEMREAGLVVARALSAAAAAVAPGCHHRRAGRHRRQRDPGAGATPSFLGYHGFPATSAPRVNDEIVHGIPRAARRLRAGDMISIDCGAIVDGWHGDAAITVARRHGQRPSCVRLIATCERAMWHGLAAARPGARLGDISHAVERCVRAAAGRPAYGIVEDYVGHGIGSEMHMDPHVLN